MSTPQSNKVITSTVHNSGGIRKSLLTPCRRIGLSRNRKKTANTVFVSPLETNEIKLVNDVVPPAIVQIKEVDNGEKLCATPTLLHKKKQLKNITNKSKDKILIKNVEQPNLSPNMKVTATKILKENNRKETNASTKKLLNKDWEIENSNIHSEDSNDNDIVRVPKACKVATKTKRKNCILDSDEEDSPFSGFPSSGSSSSSVTQVKPINDQFEIKKRKKIIISSQESDAHATDNELQINVECENSNEREINDENTLKRTPHRNNATVDVLNSNTKIIETKITLNEKSKPKIKSDKGVKRKLSLKKSISSTSSLCEGEDDALSSTPKIEDSIVDVLQHMQDKEIVEEIIKLEKTIQNKESHLQKLQQAEIYRDIHKLGDLKSETNIWKNGCQEALYDLLKKLNEHNSIDMGTMLTNLKVPQDIFKYDPENDCFL